VIQTIEPKIVDGFERAPYGTRSGRSQDVFSRGAVSWQSCAGGDRFF
jgi:hypothetical protein